MITAKDAQELLDLRKNMFISATTTPDKWFVTLRLGVELQITEAILNGEWETSVIPLANDQIVEAVAEDLIKLGFNVSFEVRNNMKRMFINWRKT
jgi:hypothetical protein